MWQARSRDSNEPQQQYTVCAAHLLPESNAVRKHDHVTRRSLFECNFHVPKIVHVTTCFLSEPCGARLPPRGCSTTQESFHVDVQVVNCTLQLSGNIDYGLGNHSTLLHDCANRSSRSGRFGLASTLFSNPCEVRFAGGKGSWPSLPPSTSQHSRIHAVLARSHLQALSSIAQRASLRSKA